jgi:hypothetical protein
MERNEAVRLCMCRMCPSFVDCKEEISFCMAVNSRSRCITKESGCLCPGCPVQDREGFSHVYYCIRGSEKEQQ